MVVLRCRSIPPHHKALPQQLDEQISCTNGVAVLIPRPVCPSIIFAEPVAVPCRAKYVFRAIVLYR